MEHVTQADPERKTRLMKGLDGFLERVAPTLVLKYNIRAVRAL